LGDNATTSASGSGVPAGRRLRLLLLLVVVDEAGKGEDVLTEEELNPGTA